MKVNYRGGDEFHVSLGNQISESIRIHEISHELLTKTTRWGTTIFLHTQLRRADRMFSRLKYHFTISDVLFQAAETTFESMAILNQILNFEEFEDYDSINQIKNSLYYSVYASDYIDLYYNALATNANIAILCRNIPWLALSTDPLSFNYTKWTNPETLSNAIMNNPELYHPDTRFKILNQTLDSLLKTQSPTQITEKQLILKSGLIVKPYDNKTNLELWDRFKNIINALFPNDVCVCEAIININNSLRIGNVQTIIDQSDFLDIPTPSDDIKTVQLKAIEPWLHNCDTLILLPYHELVILEYHIILEKTRYVIACKWQILKDVINLFNGTIILHEEDTDYLYKKSTYLHKINRFLYFEGSYQSFKECLKKRGIQNPPAYVYSVDTYTYALFVKLENNTMLFTIQNQNVLSLITSDINSGFYEYYNDPVKQNRDVFDKNKLSDQQCEDVIKSILNISNINGRCFMNPI